MAVGGPLIGYDLRLLFLSSLPRSRIWFWNDGHRQSLLWLILEELFLLLGLGPTGLLIVLFLYRLFRLLRLSWLLDTSGNTSTA